MKKALITGSCGFVGPYLKKELEQNGYTVYGVDHQKLDESNYHCVDITDKDQIKKVIEAIKPLYVYHLAGISSPSFAEENPDLTYNVNVKGTENIFNILKENKKIKILVVNSSLVYGKPEHLPIKESHPLGGKGVYADSRKKQEKLVQNYQGKVNYVVARSFNHTGAMQPEIFVIPKIVKQIVEIKKGKREMLELGNIDVKRDISDVRDVVRAYRMLLEQDKFGVICNVCRGESIKLREVVYYIKDLAGLDDIKINSDKEVINDEIFDICGDNSYLKNLIDWKSKITYKKMLKDIYKFWDGKII